MLTLDTDESVKAIAHAPLDAGADRLLGKLDHNAVERTDDFAGAIEDWNRFAPGIGFGSAEGVLSPDVCSDVLCGADRCPYTWRYDNFLTTLSEDAENFTPQHPT